MKKTFLLLLVIFMLAVSNVVYAATATVPAGTLNLSSSTDLGTITKGSIGENVASAIQFGQTGAIDVGDKIPVVTATDYLRVDDNRGNNKGWMTTVSATNLTSTVKDPTSSTGADLNVSIPISSILEASSSNLVGVNNSNVGGISLAGTDQPVTTSGVPILSAGKLKGAGAYTAEVTYKLALPNYLPSGTMLTPADPQSTIGSADVTTLGLFAGTYTTTITYSVVQAP